MEQLLKECVTYFKKRNVYKKLFNALKKKYASLGHMGGVIKLSGLSSDEKYDLEGFFKKRGKAARLFLKCIMKIKKNWNCF